MSEVVVLVRICLSGWGWKGVRSPPFIWKYEAFLLVMTLDEAFLLVVNWTMLCDWLIGQNLMSEPCVLIGQSWILSSDWSGTDGQIWVNWTVTCDWSELDDWIPQVGWLEAEYHKLAGLRSVEYHKLAGWGLSTTSWLVWGLVSTTSWLVEVWVPQVGWLKMIM
jgi:hypothetical protein